MSADNVRLALHGILAGPSHPSKDTIAKSDVDEVMEFTLNWQKHSQDASAGVETTAVPIHVAQSDFTVVGVDWIQQVASTGNATSYATLTLSQADGSGSTKLTIASHATTAGAGFAADTTKALALTTANVDVDEGQSLHFAITKTSSGVQTGPGVLVVHCRKR